MPKIAWPPLDTYQTVNQIMDTFSCADIDNTADITDISKYHNDHTTSMHGDYHTKRLSHKIHIPKGIYRSSSCHFPMKYDEVGRYTLKSI